MLKCLLIDDELLSLKYLQLLCEQLADVEIVKSFVDPEVFLNQYQELDFDFCILDIEMPKMSGLQIADILKDIPVIFVTAYKEYAFDAFELNAVDYLAKPIKLERLSQAIEKVRKRVQQNKKTDVVYNQYNSDKGKVILNLDKIAFIKTSVIDSRDKVVVYDDLSEIILKNVTLNKLLENLPEHNFLRINKREIIRLQYVKYYSTEEIVLGINQSEYKFSLSEFYRNNFVTNFSN